MTSNKNYSPITEQVDGHVREDNDEREAIPAKEKITVYQRTKAFIFMGLTSVILSFTGAGAKYLDHIPIAEFTFFKFIIPTLILLSMIFHKTETIDTKGSLSWVILRCVVGATAGVLKYWSYVELEYGDATAILNIMPFLAALTSRIFLKHRINIPTILAGCIGLVGIVLIAKPGFIFSGDKKSEYSHKAMIPFISAILISTAYTIMQKVSREINIYIVPTCLSGFITLFSVAFFAIRPQPLVLPSCYGDRNILLLCSVSTVIGLVFLNAALLIERTGPVSLVRSLDVILAYCIQVAIFSKIPDQLSFIGGALILVSVVVVTVDKVYLQSIPFFRKYQI